VVDNTLQKACFGILLPLIGVCALTLTFFSAYLSPRNQCWEW